MYILVDKISNPAHPEFHGKWYVGVTESHRKPYERVFMADKRKDCVEYAKTLVENPVDDKLFISSGRTYGAKW